MIKKFEEYINEDYFSKLANRKDNKLARKENALNPNDVKEFIKYLNEYIHDPGVDEEGNLPDEILCDTPYDDIDSVIYFKKDGKTEKFCTVGEIVSFIQDDMIVCWSLVNNPQTEEEAVEWFYKESPLSIDDWWEYIDKDYGDNYRVIGLCLFGDMNDTKKAYREQSIDFKDFEFGKYRNKYNVGIK